MHLVYTESLAFMRAAGVLQARLSTWSHLLVQAGVRNREISKGALRRVARSPFLPKWSRSVGPRTGAHDRVQPDRCPQWTLRASWAAWQRRRSTALSNSTSSATLNASDFGLLRPFPLTALELENSVKSHQLASSFFALFLASAPALAQDFPEGATTISAADLTQRLADKVFSVSLKNGTSWRLQFNGNGYFYNDVSTGLRANGTWSTEDSRICTQVRGSNRNCNDVKLHDGFIYHRRNDGEIIKYVPM